MIKITKKKNIVLQLKNNKNTTNYTNYTDTKNKNKLFFSIKNPRTIKQLSIKAKQNTTSIKRFCKVEFKGNILIR